MRVLLIAGRVSSLAWTPGEVVRVIASGLVERGHQVSMIAESVDDPALFASCASVCAMHTFEQSASDFPVGFASWARRQRREIGHDACVSLSRVVRDGGVDVWMPLDPRASAWLGDLIGARGLVRSVPTIAKHAGVVAQLVSVRGVRARRVLAIGAVAAQGARQAARGAEVRELEFFSPAEPMDEPRAAAGRRRVRGLLGVPDDRVLIAVGTTGRVGRSLLGLLSEVAQAHGPMSPIAGPMLVFLTREQFPVHTLAVRAGAGEFVRVVGTTASAGEVIGACDAVAIPTPASGGAFGAGAMGRLAATALKLGKPLIAAAGAPGAELCSRRASDHSECGTVVDGSFGSWRRALRMAADESWRSKAGSAGAEVGRGMSMAGLVSAVAAAVEP